MNKRFIFLVVAVCFSICVQAQEQQAIAVIAYYSAGPEQVENIAAEKLTHIIFSFCHLKGNALTVDNAKDSATIRNLVKLKQRNPTLKVILSLGGWGGCAACSEIFSTPANRKAFARSVVDLHQTYQTDGLDLDWEYPTIEGYPGHRYAPEDKNNFTALVRELRRAFGQRYELSFAAGGFQKFLEESVDWKAVMPEVDRVNLMTYDLVNGYATQTGHHTALYPRPEQKESTDNCVQYLLRLGVPRNKLVIGSAFYGRMWEEVPDRNNGLYQPGKFKSFVDYRRLRSEFSADNGFTRFWDDVAKAPYLYNPSKKLFITYDDKASITLKTHYVLDYNLDGIMFWELSCDAPSDGLLDAIDTAKKRLKSKP